jgi:hypothetical protein
VPKPSEESFKQLFDNEAFKWFIEKTAAHLNDIDTVRDFDPEKPDQTNARKIAIEIIESIFADLVNEKELARQQTLQMLKEQKEKQKGIPIEKDESDY